jgi:hypothetical protein
MPTAFETEKKNYDFFGYSCRSRTPAHYSPIVGFRASVGMSRWYVFQKFDIAANYDLFDGAPTNCKDKSNRTDLFSVLYFVLDWAALFARALSSKPHHYFLSFE